MTIERDESGWWSQDLTGLTLNPLVEAAAMLVIASTEGVTDFDELEIRKEEVKKLIFGEKNKD